MWLNSPSLSPDRKVCLFLEHRSTAPTAYASQRWRPWRGLEQFTILTNARRIDPVSFVATQLGAHEVSNLGGIDDADNMTGLIQRTRDAETIAPGGRRELVGSFG
jgi:hypothetical protein